MDVDLRRSWAQAAQAAQLADRHAELGQLLEYGFVSRFAHRNRITKLLRDRFTRSVSLQEIEESRPPIRESRANSLLEIWRTLEMSTEEAGRTSSRSQSIGGWKSRRSKLASTFEQWRRREMSTEEVGRTPSTSQSMNCYETLSGWKSRMDGIYIELNNLERAFVGGEKPSNLKLSLLQLITNNFSEELKIGHGGCGVVYMGILPDKIIAVKRLLNSHTVDDRMFHQEVQSLMKVKHQNVVRFLGYCSHTEEQAKEMAGKIIMAEIRERLLCFEYVNNGSLKNFLADELRGLDWHTRFQVIKGICEGLHHLHKEKHIIHMDLKPENVLVDDQMVPKITDFGLSRLDDTTHTMSAERFLSLGYCAPEYLHHGKRSAKSDIYSLGVIIMELVTGSKEKPNIQKVLKRWKHRWNKSAIDTLLLSYKQVDKCLGLAQRCMHHDPRNRPNIWDIVSDLKKMDTNDENIIAAHECLELDDMLGIEPLEIHLPIELNKQVSCSVELINNTDGYFAYKISTTSLRPYIIDPTKDIVLPRSKLSVTITLQALEETPSHNHRKDEFSVQSVRVDESITGMHITQDLFDEETGKVIDEVDLTIVLATHDQSVWHARN